jgi:hypothetical protein
VRFDLFAAAVVLIVGVVICGVLTRHRKQDPAGQSRTSSVPAGGIPDTNYFADSLPKQRGPQGYVSSATCKECHPKQFETWWRSYHRKMTQVMNTNTVQAKFDGVIMYSGRGALHVA